MRTISTARLRRVLTNILAANFVFLAGAQALADSPTIVTVADTSTYVSIARVDLAVGAMSVDAGQLVGTYSIDVPLRQSKSEKGRITLPLTGDLKTYLEAGGTLSGKGVSAKKIDDNTRKIKARFSPYDAESKEGRIHLTIETSQRTFEFDSTYTLSEPVSQPTD